jgi:GYF domain 2
MPTLWYFADQEVTVGPLSLNELKDTIATFPNPENVLIWSNHLPDWKRARVMIESGTPSALNRRTAQMVEIPELVMQAAPAAPPHIQIDEAVSDESPEQVLTEGVTDQHTGETPPPAVWYYAEAGRQKGPVSLQELKATLSTVSDVENVLIWSNHLPNWKRAADIPELGWQIALPAHQPTQINEATKPQTVLSDGSPEPAALPTRTQPVVAQKDYPPAPGGMLKWRWFAKIETREDAVRTINETSIAFFAVAAIQAVLGIFLYGSEIFIDVALYVGFAAWLRYGKSRIAAVALLAQAGISMAITIAALLRLTTGGRNLILAAIVFYAAAKASEATFKLHGRFKTCPGPKARLSPIT